MKAEGKVLGKAAIEGYNSKNKDSNTSWKMLIQSCATKDNKTEQAENPQKRVGKNFTQSIIWFFSVWKI